MAYDDQQRSSIACVFFRIEEHGAESAVADEHVDKHLLHNEDCQVALHFEAHPTSVVPTCVINRRRALHNPLVRCRHQVRDRSCGENVGTIEDVGVRDVGDKMDRVLVERIWAHRPEHWADSEGTALCVEQQLLHVTQCSQSGAATKGGTVSHVASSAYENVDSVISSVASSMASAGAQKSPRCCELLAVTGSSERMVVSTWRQWLVARRSSCHCME
eukprot:2940080-Prymnesium_polylepis.1